MAASDPLIAVGLDTSVLLRVLTSEPAAQAERAFSFLNELRLNGGRAIVSDLVVTEAYYALHTHYGVPKHEALRALLDILQSDLAAPEPEGCSVEVLRSMGTATQKPGFVDRLIHAQYLRAGSRLVSFEAASGKLHKTVVLRA